MTFIGGFIVSLIIGIVTLGFGAIFINIVWAFMYNKYYTTKLLQAGYVFNDSEGLNAQAAAALSVAAPTVSTVLPKEQPSASRDLST